jgi:hypothetical protein
MPRVIVVLRHTKMVAFVATP